MTCLGQYTMFWDETKDKYRITFVAHGYERTSPWLKSKKLALRWAADFWD